MDFDVTIDEMKALAKYRCFRFFCFSLNLDRFHYLLVRFSVLLVRLSVNLDRFSVPLVRFPGNLDRF